jgi:hypothetical protein
MIVDNENPDPAATQCSVSLGRGPVAGMMSISD